MEDIKEIIRKLKLEFYKIGARVKIIPFTPTSKLFKSNLFSVSITTDEHGEFFEILVSRDLINTLKVVRVNLDSKHLIITAENKSQYMCGVFERTLYKNDLNAPMKVAAESRTESYLSDQNAESQLYYGKPSLNFNFIRYLFNLL